MLRASDAGDGLPELEATHDGGARLDALIGEVLRLRDELIQADQEARRTGQSGEPYRDADRVVSEWLAGLIDTRDRLHVGGHTGETELREEPDPSLKGQVPPSRS